MHECLGSVEGWNIVCCGERVYRVVSLVGKGPLELVLALDLRSITSWPHQGCRLASCHVVLAAKRYSSSIKGYTIDRIWE